MSSTRDPKDLINAYLQDGLDELPERSFDAVRSAIDQTRQWVVIGPWKEPQIMTATRFAVIAAAIAVMAVVAIRFLPNSNIGPSAPSPTATPSRSLTQSASLLPNETPTSTATPSSAVRLPDVGADVVPLRAGSYYINESYYLGAIPNVNRLTFTLPDGWTGKDPFIRKNGDGPGEVAFTEWVVTHVFDDACHWGTLVDAGTTPEDLMTVLAAQKGRTASAVSDATVGGFAAKRIDLTVPADTDVSGCTGGILRYWPDPGPDLSGGLCCNRPGNTDVVYAVDVAGGRLVLVTRTYPSSSAADKAELQSVMDSIQIEPLLATPSAAVALPDIGRDLRDVVPLAAGSYYIDDSHYLGAVPNVNRLTFSLPGGWSGKDRFIRKNGDQPGEVGFTVWTVTDIFADVCHWDERSVVNVGTTPDQLIRALSHAQKGREEASSAPLEVTLGGYPAEAVALQVPTDLDTSTCTNGVLRYWPDSGPDFTGGLCCNQPGNVDFIYAVDVGSRPLVVVARTYPGSSEADKAELQSVIDSIRIDLLPALEATPSASVT